MIYPENFAPNMHKIEYKIGACLIYNPTIKPKKLKAYEEDIQDSKLLFYYPRETLIEEKRNQVGLIEGVILFFTSFNTKSDNTNQIKTQVIYLDEYVYIISNPEKDIWVCIILDSHTKEMSYFTNNDISNTYLHQDIFKNYKENLTYDLCHKFITHFVNYFELFYGPISNYLIEDQLNEKFHVIFSMYILNYQKINASGNFGTNPSLKLNMIKYYDNHLNYAPTGKKSFLGLNYLLTLLQTIDPKIMHYTVFYHGYFIYSTLEHKIAQMISDYFYSSSDLFEIDLNKIDKKFVKIDRNNPNIWDRNFTYGALLDLNGKKGFLSGPIEPLSDNYGKVIIIDYLKEETINDTQNKDKCPVKELYTPNIWIKDNEGVYKSFKSVIYCDNGLLIMMNINNDDEININKLIRIRNAINHNIKKFSTGLDNNLEEIYSEVEENRFYYLNYSNLAMRVSKSFLKAIIQDTSRILCEMKTTFTTKNECKLLVNKIHDNFWIYAKEYSSRKIFILIDGEVSLNQLENEKKQIIDSSLPTILIQVNTNKIKKQSKSENKKIKP